MNGITFTKSYVNGNDAVSSTNQMPSQDKIYVNKSIIGTHMINGSIYRFQDKWIYLVINKLIYK